MGSLVSLCQFLALLFIVIAIVLADNFGYVLRILTTTPLTFEEKYSLLSILLDGIVDSFYKHYNRARNSQKPWAKL